MVVGGAVAQPIVERIDLRGVGHGIVDAGQSPFDVRVVGLLHGGQRVGVGGEVAGHQGRDGRLVGAEVGVQDGSHVEELGAVQDMLHVIAEDLGEHRFGSSEGEGRNVDGFARLGPSGIQRLFEGRAFGGNRAGEGVAVRGGCVLGALGRGLHRYRVAVVGEHRVESDGDRFGLAAIHPLRGGQCVVQAVEGFGLHGGCAVVVYLRIWRIAVGGDVGLRARVARALGIRGLRVGIIACGDGGGCGRVRIVGEGGCGAKRCCQHDGQSRPRDATECLLGHGVPRSAGPGRRPCSRFAVSREERRPSGVEPPSLPN